MTLMWRYCNKLSTRERITVALLSTTTSHKCHGISNYRYIYCLFTSLFGLAVTGTSKGRGCVKRLHVMTSSCAANHTCPFFWSPAGTVSARSLRYTVIKVQCIFSAISWSNIYPILRVYDLSILYITGCAIPSTYSSLIKLWIWHSLREQATVLDARASRVKWPAQVMSHWYGILFTE